ncbi:hypothetical protein P280DRAFT_471813 [Massarina eburnea CBS 473.64]|uniref:Uncharacterized protein n=1 Tax=Massarina eburnea CBS 473.64 TaxID=1395130 RepID=A0A6A6RS28_9PLEO|nr:hypothetical protein P280DRAFT_471813 [Massarina eburnea CBS 473.64]
MTPRDPWAYDEEDEWTHNRHVSGVRHIRPPPRVRDDGFGHRSANFLVPDAHAFSSHQRSRSQGNLPQPNVTIYNNTRADTRTDTRTDNDLTPNIRTEQKSPMMSPAMADRGRSLRMPGEWSRSLEDEIAELRHEVKKVRSRSRSDHRHHHEDAHAAEFERYKLEQANQRLREAEEKLDMERHDELIKRRMELKYLKDRREREEEEAHIKADEDRLKREWELRMTVEEKQRADREREKSLERRRIIAENTARMEKEEQQRQQHQKAQDEERRRIVAENTARLEKEEMLRQKRQRDQEEDRRRIILENTARMQKEEREAQDARQRAVDEFNKEQAAKERKAQQERERVVAEYEAKKVSDAAKARKQREELVMQLKIEEEQRKQREKEEWDRFIMKQKQREEQEKAEKEKADKELEEQMRQRLAHFGFQENQIQAMIKPEEARKLQQGLSPANPLRLTHSPAYAKPTYVKVHKEYLAAETLDYYEIPYEYDRTNPDYIIIMEEMDPGDTEVLFEHTRRLRSRGTSSSSRLLIEERSHGKKPEYAFVRRRQPSRSPSRRRSSPPKRVVGIREMFI